MSNLELQPIIDAAWENRADLSPSNCPAEAMQAVDQVLYQLDSGQSRVSSVKNGQWISHEWLKKAVLLSFKIKDNQVIQGATTLYYDKVPLKYANTDQKAFKAQGVRIVPPATVRYGAYIAPNVVVMPSYINIGAYVDSGTMVDTWATVGSCAQIGKNVHLSGGVGIGGVLEPLQATPTIIEDDCFIGARSEVVEGVIVEKGSVLSMGVYVGKSTPIYHRDKDEVSYGRIPAGSVVVPGTIPSKTGNCQLYAAIIVKTVDEKTRAKVGINELLRLAE